jgi:sialidase-1
LKNPGWQAVFATSGTDIQTQSGRFLVPLVARDAATVIHSVNAYSDDHGKSWKVGELIGDRTDESHNAELADGTILQNMRQDVRTIKARAIAASHDGGVSFSPIHYDETLVDPSCNAGFFRYHLGAEDLLVFTNAASTVREKLTVHLSMDGGKSWPVARVIYPGPTAYSTAIQLHDGSIGVLYEHGEHFEVEKITFVRFTLDWARGH